jgi:MFS family permease
MTFLLDFDAMFFGMPRALFPALAETHFHGDASTAGLLYAAPAIGALLGGVLSGPLGRIRRQGLAVIASIAVWGLAITGFGLSPYLWLGVLLLGIAGAADLASAVIRRTILWLPYSRRSLDIARLVPLPVSHHQHLPSRPDRKTNKTILEVSSWGVFGEWLVPRRQVT